MPASGRAVLNPRSVVLFSAQIPGSWYGDKIAQRIKVDWAAEAPKELWRQLLLATIGATQEIAEYLGAAM
ncbi:hypothetical protein [Bradyrhizobium australiense]|uniref:Uncharacterized protein n=1 Tax=Bradyrhizobium australiense TaxID=2721161 RepID=A0A7Y4GXP8_9BRAD|nr:hypothetical protein [Bradyrhizobium australiense]NOJ43899.1 hypothetical protein [Bradyrhizobium australiense]